MLKFIAAAALLFATTSHTWLTNLDEARVQAKKENKAILLNFSGSDWCIPCIKMHSEVFSDPAFEKYAADNLVLVNADFPRNKKNQLNKEQQKINDALADKFNPTGAFPFTVLLDNNGNKLRVWDGLYTKGISTFIQEIQEASGKY
ncbi:MAG: thioredoxin family protein [Bacteroidetes bacterium]|nr:thioredoxin family protein [Bacteroidota bacterium]